MNNIATPLQWLPALLCCKSSTGPFGQHQHHHILTQSLPRCTSNSSNPVVANKLLGLFTPNFYGHQTAFPLINGKISQMHSSDEQINQPFIHSFIQSPGVFVATGSSPQEGTHCLIHFTASRTTPAKYL